jgi:hypothetical protein
MTRRISGRATRTIGARAEAIWQVAVPLNWLVTWDKVDFASTPENGSTFVLWDGRRAIRARFTRFEVPTALDWRVDDGGSGSLRLTTTGDSTYATWDVVDVPHALIDRLAVAAMSLAMPSKVRKLSDQDAAKELRGLANRVKRQQQREPGN